MTSLTLLQEIEAAELSATEEHSAIERLILKHAMRSFGRRGYAATTLRGIASDVNVTAPLVSYYFKSKENLYSKVAEIVMRSLEAEVARTLETERPFFDTIVAIVDTHARLAESSPSAVEFMFSMLYGPEQGQPSLDINQLYEPTFRMIYEQFERGIETGAFVPREGMDASFLTQQLGNVIHSHATSVFKAKRFLEHHPDKRDAVERRLHTVSLDVAIQHFFFGAGDVPARRQT